MSESPKQIGKYEIVGLLGKGAMGTVYKGRDPILNRFVAIKMISANLLSESELNERFLREARAAAQLNHPNIVTVYEFADDDSGVFLVMELLEGESLQQAIESNQLGGLDLRLDILEQICEGLGFAHEAEIVHRDLKPGNIHINKDGRAKLLDFGLAPLPSSEMTTTGIVMGTPNYMSPEQVNGESDVDVRSDVFSMGVICYEMLTGQKPFEADTLTQTMFRIVQGKREPLRNFSQVPPPLATIVEQALSLDRESRPQNATELLIQLQDVRDESIAVAQQLDFDGQAGTVIVPTGPAAGRPRASRSGVRSTQTVSPASRTTPSIHKTAHRDSPPPTASIGRKIGIIVSGVALAALLGGGFMWMRSPGSGKSDGTNPELIASQQERVQQSFDQKDFGLVLIRADQLLELDAENALAANLRQEAIEILAAIDGITAEGRVAIDAGDMELAAVALAQLRELSPAHPGVTELRQTLSGQISARSNPTPPATPPELTTAAPATPAPPTTISDTRPATPVPTNQPAAEAVSSTDPALQQAVDQAVAEWTTTNRQAQAEGIPTGDLATARDIIVQAESQIFSGDLARAALTYQAATRELATAIREHQARAADRLPAAGPAATAAVLAVVPPVAGEEDMSVTSPPSVLAVREEDQIIQVLAQYEQAIETEDIALYRAAKPNLSGEEQRRLEASFDVMDAHAVELQVQSVNIQGETATVETSRQDQIEAGGQTQTNSMQQTFTFARQGGSWVIVQTSQ